MTAARVLQVLDLYGQRLLGLNRRPERALNDASVSPLNHVLWMVGEVRTMVGITPNGFGPKPCSVCGGRGGFLIPLPEGLGGDGQQLDAAPCSGCGGSGSAPPSGKVFRWLGFMQGVLWTLNVYTIDELRRHNMPEGTEFEERA